MEDLIPELILLKKEAESRKQIKYVKGEKYKGIVTGNNKNPHQLLSNTSKIMILLA